MGPTFQPDSGQSLGFRISVQKTPGVLVKNPVISDLGLLDTILSALSRVTLVKVIWCIYDLSLMYVMYDACIHDVLIYDFEDAFFSGRTNKQANSKHKICEKMNCSGMGQKYPIVWIWFISLKKAVTWYKNTKWWGICARYFRRRWARGTPHYNASSVLGPGPTPRISLAAKFEYFPRRNFDWVRRCNFGHRHPLCFGILQTICGRQLSNLCSLVGAPSGIILLL